MIRGAVVACVLALAACGGASHTAYVPEPPGAALPNQVAPLLVPSHGALTVPGTAIRTVRTAHGTAVADLSGREPSFAWSAAIVYTLTEDPAIRRVRLTLNGRPCCFRMMDGSPAPPATRATFHGWTGEPCAFRDATVRRCRK
jgi:hypothetical protein